MNRVVCPHCQLRLSFRSEHSCRTQRAKLPLRAITSTEQLDKRAQYHIAAVVPAYNVAAQIGSVVATLPEYVRTIVVVNDCSEDETAEVVRRLQLDDPRVVLVNHEQNRARGPGESRSARGLTRKEKR